MSRYISCKHGLGTPSYSVPKQAGTRNIRILATSQRGYSNIIGLQLIVFCFSSALRPWSKKLDAFRIRIFFSIFSSLMYCEVLHFCFWLQCQKSGRPNPA
ncbi:hypothetical protein F4821DRAFT_172147 [Hypoxylon rubiginosum]|uniref:Uncharacterized protein n=1 Tax=Hypoxylon rubiginosum TaxID=110542 RepID=A0ACC0DGM0_9PEZI|nr:hypothetical protein F4821DRAFT_172147 [Hypoxylon rubiginosum]